MHTRMAFGLPLLMAAGLILGYPWVQPAAPPTSEETPAATVEPRIERAREMRGLPRHIAEAPRSETVERLVAGLSALRQEADADRRVERILEVWRAAADGEISQDVLAELGSFTFDPDPEIARTAALAIQDLEQLAAQRAEEDAVDQWSQPPGPERDRAPAPEDAQALDEDRWLRESADLEQRLAAVFSADPDERLAAIQELWRTAADTSEPGLLDWALDEIDALASPASTPEIAERLAAAAEDLRRLADERAVQAEIEPAAAVADLDTDGWAGETQAPDLSESRSFARNAEAAAALLGEYDEERDPNRRLTLAAALSGYEPGMAVQLVMLGLQDPDASIRHSSVHLLWRQAADGHGSLSDVFRALEQALLDPDPQVRESTLVALEDLEALESRFDPQ